MKARLNFYNGDTLIFVDTTTQFKDKVLLKNFLNKVKNFILGDKVLKLIQFTIKELDVEYDRDVDVDLYCTMTKEDGKVEEKVQKDLFEF